MVAPSGDSDQEIRIRMLVVGTNDAIDRIKEFGNAIDDMALKIAQLSVASKRSFDEIANQLKKAVEKPTKEKFQQRDELGKVIGFDKEGFKAAQKEYQDTIDAISKGVTEAKKNEAELTAFVKAQIDQRTAYMKKASVEQIASDKLRLQELVRNAQESAKAQREQERAGIIDPQQLAVKAREQAVQASSAYQQALKNEQVALQQASIASANYAVKQTDEAKAASVAADAQVKKAQESSAAAKQVAKDADAEAKALGKIPKVAGEAAGAFTKLGSVAKYVFGTILGVTAISALRNFFRSMAEITEQGYEFIKSMYKAGVAINSLRFRGVNASIEKTVELVNQLREEFGVLSEKEALNVVSTTQLLTRNLGYTEEQIKNVIRVSTALAIVQGKEVTETARQLVLFFSSGYGEGLQKAGIAVNRFVVGQKAMEMGLGTSYMALTEQQRALAGYTIVMEQVREIVDEASKFQENLAGEIDKTVKTTETLKNRMGVLLVPLKKFWVEFQLAAVQSLSTIIKYVSNTIIAILELDLVVRKIVLDFQEQWGVSEEFLERGRKNLEETKKAIEDIKEWSKDFDLAEQMANVLEESALREFEVEVEPILDDEAATKVAEDLIDILKDASEKLIDIEGDLQDSLIDIDEEGAAEREGIWAELAADILKIEQDLAADIAELHRDLANDIAEVQQEMQDDLADAAEDYRYEEWKAERDYQEKMRRLREGFLFDLEDALRERDAVQIMRLYRQYALDTTQAKRQYEMEQEERQIAYQKEIADIREQAAKRIEELKREAAIREAELIAQAAKEKALLEEAAKVDYTEALEEFRQYLEDRLRALALSLALEEGLNTDQIRGILMLLQDEFADAGISATEYSSILEEALKKAEDDLILHDKLIDEIQKSLEEVAATPSISPISVMGPSGVGSTYPKIEQEIEVKFDPAVSEIESELKNISDTANFSTQEGVGDLQITTSPVIDDIISDLDKVSAKATFSEQENVGEIPIRISPSSDEIITDLDAIDAAATLAPKQLKIEVIPTAEELQEELQAREDAAQEEYDDMTDDFKKFWDDKQKILEAALKKEYWTVKNYTNGMILVFRYAFGPGGVVEGIYTYLIALINNMVIAAQNALNVLYAMAEQAAALAAQISSVTTTTSGSGAGTGGSYPTQTGGYVGRSIRSLGEGGYEFVINNPTTRALEYALGEKLTQEKLLAAVIGKDGENGSNMNKAVIEVWLSPGLEGEIVDKAMDGVAEVFDTVIRRR